MLFQAIRSDCAANVRAGVKFPAGLVCAGSEPREKVRHRADIERESISQRDVIGEGQRGGPDNRAAVGRSVELLDKGRRASGSDEIHVRGSAEAIDRGRCFKAESGHNLMARFQRAKCRRLPECIGLLPSLRRVVCERRNSSRIDAEQIDAALRRAAARWPASLIDRSGIEMRDGILIARLHNALGRIRRDVAPSGLQEVELIGFAQVLKAVRRDERWSHALAGEYFESRGSAPIREIVARAAVQQIELIVRSSLHAQARIAKEHSATEIISRRGDGNCLRGPLAGERNV